MKPNKPIKSIQKQAEITFSNRAATLLFFICLSPVFYGYSLAMIGASDLEEMVEYYHISIPKETMLAMLNGALPIGGIIGSYIFSKVRHLTTKKKLHNFLAITTLIVCSVSLVPSYPFLVFCRLILGMIASHYMALTINLIKEHFPDRLWKPYGAVFSATRILGILICHTLGYLFLENKTRAGNYILFFGPAVIAGIQVFALYHKLPQSPVELLRKQDEKKALESILFFFDQKNAKQRLEELKEKLRRSIPKYLDNFSNPLNVCGVHLALLRQFSGVTYLVVYASQIPIHQRTSIGSSAIFIENVLQMIGGLLGILFVSYFSRYYMVTISTIVLMVLSLALGVSSLLEQSIMSFVSICLYMFICGSCLDTIIWIYPSQICTPKMEKYASMMSMTGTAMVTMLPPFIVASLPEQEAYPLFLFFGLYLFLASILNVNLLPRDEPEVATVQLQRLTYLN